MTPETSSDNSHLDIIIVGGGPSGMSAALTAGRALLDVAIVNSETPRNAVTTASHGFLTRDGAHPTELLGVAKEQLMKYETVSYRNDSVTTVTTNTSGFDVALASGAELTTDRLIIATGHTDDLELLALVGLEDVYGKSVYPCLFCDGFEHQGERLALFGSEGAIHYAPMARLWTDDLMVFTNGGSLAPEDQNELQRNGVAFRTEKVRRIESTNGAMRTVVLETGERIDRDAGFISDDYSRPTTAFAKTLGVTSSTNDWGMTALDADALGTTAVDGLYVIGDARTGFSGLIAAAAEGAACVEVIVHEIASDRWVKR